MKGDGIPLTPASGPLLPRKDSFAGVPANKLLWPITRPTTDHKENEMGERSAAHAMKTNARIVVVGGGMMGASLLYHLALEGCTDTVLIEKNELTSGSTWHAAGQCPSITGSYNLAKIHAYSNQLYRKLEALTGQYVSWHPCG